MDGITRNNKIKELESTAAEVLELKKEHRQRRPIFIEFCGSPKSGKTSCINSLNIFLKRNKFRTCVLTERANVCPIKDKHNPYFNVWTCCAAITGITRSLDAGKDLYDVIIADRALFDGLCWFCWLNKNGHLSDDDYAVLRHFVTMRMWKRCTDFVYIFKATPEESIKREYAHLLTKKPGSIMNKKVLNEYNQAIDEIYDLEKNTVRAVERIDTTSLKQDEVSFKVTGMTLDILRNILVEKIGYFLKPEIEKIIKQGVTPAPGKLMEKQLEYAQRDEVEAGENIQPIAIAVLTNVSQSRVLVVEKNPKHINKYLIDPNERSPEEDKLILWVGGHIREEDQENTFGQTTRNALARELKEELDIPIEFDRQERPHIIYTPAVAKKSKRHFAICYIKTVDFDTLRIRLDSYELKQRKGKTMSGRVVEIQEILSGKNRTRIEAWSKEILKTVFKQKINLWDE